MGRNYAIFEHLPDNKIYFAEILDESKNPYANTHLSTNLQMIFDLPLVECVDLIKDMFGDNFHVFSNYIQINTTQEIRTALLEHAQIPKVSGRNIAKTDIGDYVTVDKNLWG